MEETDEERKQLMIEAEKQEKKADKQLDSVPNQVQLEAHLGPGIVKSMKKFENIKLQNFMETLFEQSVNAERFSAEIERYFLYHSIRKTKVIQALQEQYRGQNLKRERLISSKVNRAPREYVSSQNKSSNLLYQLFVQKYNEIREDMRTRKTFTMLSNMKSLKIRTDKIDIPELQSINVTMFKPQDKKLLIDLFCNDEQVQSICNQILVNIRSQHNDINNMELLTMLNSDYHGNFNQIDSHGNLIKRAKSYTQTAFIQGRPPVMVTGDMMSDQIYHQTFNTNQNTYNGRPYTSEGELMSQNPNILMQYQSENVTHEPAYQQMSGQQFNKPKVSRLNSAAVKPVTLAGRGGNRRIII